MIFSAALSGLIVTRVSAPPQKTGSLEIRIVNMLPPQAAIGCTLFGGIKQETRKSSGIRHVRQANSPKPYSILVRQANGDLVRAMFLYKLRPNDDDNFVDGEQNQALAVEMATLAAREVSLPRK